MKNFLQWAEDNKHALPVFNDAPEGQDNDTVKGKKTTDEKTKRTGLSGNYPPAYIGGVYPDAYFPPIKATAFLDLKNMKNTKKPANTAAN